MSKLKLINKDGFSYLYNMKIEKTDFNHVLKIVERTLQDCSETLGISFKIEEAFIYGSQLTNKKDPNDIDIFVKVNSIKIKNQLQFLSSYGPTPDKITEYDLMEIAYIWLHENQPTFKNTPIDINFRDYDFDLDGEVISLY
jgi:hypothetical protein